MIENQHISDGRLAADEPSVFFDELRRISSDLQKKDVVFGNRSTPEEERNRMREGEDGNNLMGQVGVE
jgi:hypothetical protein